ncbi:hypothetical protein L204_101397 [Cryptococcus depauperatus]|nr:hypothetical protein L204_04068 [Cryptococcus depauperatus CBS 7855]
MRGRTTPVTPPSSPGESESYYSSSYRSSDDGCKDSYSISSSSTGTGSYTSDTSLGTINTNSDTGGSERSPWSPGITSQGSDSNPPSSMSGGSSPITPNRPRDYESLEDSRLQNQDNRPIPLNTPLSPTNPDSGYELAGNSPINSRLSVPKPDAATEERFRWIRKILESAKVK